MRKRPDAVTVTRSKMVMHLSKSSSEAMDEEGDHRGAFAQPIRKTRDTSR